MKSPSLWAAAFLATGFAVVSYALIRIEPGMGFVTPADYFNPVKVAAGYASVSWHVVDLLYLSFPVAILVLARSSVSERISYFGLAAAVCALCLGAVDRVGIQLPSLFSNGEDAQQAVAALLPIRFAVLKTTVVMLGAFAWATTRVNSGRGLGIRLFRALGWLLWQCASSSFSCSSLCP